MNTNRRPTMTDVAARAEVSLKTVSRVVNGAPSVDPVIAGRVQRAILELGFQRNLVAAGLRAGWGTSTVGLMTTDLKDPFFGAVAEAVDREARARGFQVVMAGTGESPQLEKQVALDLCRRQVRGLMIVPTSGSFEYLADEVGRGLAVVFVDRPGHGIEADCVTIDNRHLGHRMANLVVARGHRRIGILVGSDAIFTHHERFLGVRERLAEMGHVIDPDLVVHDVSEPLGAAGGARRILELQDPPTALLCTNNRLTLGALTAMAQTGLVAEVVAFDDPEYSEILPVPVTLIAQDPAVLGRVAASRLFARLEGDASAPQRVVLPTQIVVRGGNWPGNVAGVGR